MYNGINKKENNVINPDNKTHYSKDLSKIENKTKSVQSYKKIYEDTGEVSEEFDYDKAKKLVEDLRQGKKNPLKCQGQSVRIFQFSILFYIR